MNIILIYDFILLLNRLSNINCLTRLILSEQKHIYVLFIKQKGKPRYLRCSKHGDVI